MMRESKMHNKHIAKGMKGSFTIEASVILPLIVYILLLVVYLSFYLYSSYVLSLDAYMSVFRGSRADMLCDNAYQVTEKAMQTFLTEQLPAVGDIEYNIQSTMWKTRMEVQGKVKIPFLQTVWNHIFPLYIVRYAERTEPVFFLRNCRKIQAGLTERQDL